MPANTTRYALPYPLPTEPVAEGAQAIRNLAEATDAMLIGSKSPGSQVAQVIGSASAAWGVGYGDIPFQSTEFSLGTSFTVNVAAGTVTVSRAGCYVVSGAVTFAYSAVPPNQLAHLELYVSGFLLARESIRAPQSVTVHGNVSLPIQLSAGAVVSIRLNLEVGANLTNRRLNIANLS